MVSLRTCWGVNSDKIYGLFSGIIPAGSMMARAIQATRIKFCGITRSADAEAARELGVDAIGLVFYAASPRSVSIKQAKILARAVGPFVTLVGLFVNAHPEDINHVLQDVPLQLLQFHGEESANFCRQFGRPWIKALRMKPGIAIEHSVREYCEASAILLDSYKEGIQGGSGEVFAWDCIPGNLDLPIILAGGLNPDNVAEAVRQVKPYAVDVSSGIEMEPGKKDPVLMKAFIDAIREK